MTSNYFKETIRKILVIKGQNADQIVHFQHPDNVFFLNLD